MRAAEARTPPPLTVFAPTPVAPHQRLLSRYCRSLWSGRADRAAPCPVLQGAENLRIHQPDPHLPRLPTATTATHTYVNTQSHTQPYMCVPHVSIIMAHTIIYMFTHIYTLTHACTRIVHMYTHVKHTATHACTQNHNHTLRTQSYGHIQSQHTHTNTSHTSGTHNHKQVHTHTPFGGLWSPPPVNPGILGYLKVRGASFS